jgi:hypothetical protein
MASGVHDAGATADVRKPYKLRTSNLTVFDWCGLRSLAQFSCRVGGKTLDLCPHGSAAAMPPIRHLVLASRTS